MILVCVCIGYELYTVVLTVSLPIELRLQSPKNEVTSPPTVHGKTRLMNTFSLR